MLSSNALRRVASTTALVALALLEATEAAAQTPLPGRIEILALHSKTLSTQEFLRGNAAGREVALGGELRLPFNVPGKVPAVVLVHGSGGIGGGADAWARALNEAGVAAFILDSFSGRGIVNTIEDQSQLDSIAMMVDAYRALDLLAAHPRIRADRIAVMGFSKGAVAAVFSAADRFKSAYGSANTFAAHIGMYTPCNTRFTDDTKVSRVPIRLFHGVTDDYVNIVPCRDFVAELKAAGANVSLTEYPDTQHAFDTPTLPTTVLVPKAQSTRDCRLKEGRNGIILNAATQAPFSIKSDACMAIGAHVRYNPEATAAARGAVSGFIKQVLVN
jgi:dienelactone hydrolase